jgi:hypothetical protein
LLQIGWFLRAAGVEVGVQETIARVPPAIFAGLLPITLWGVGTRDAALVHLFADLAPASTMAVVGMLTALRYVVPGAVGIALVPGAFAFVRNSRPSTAPLNRALSPEGRGSIDPPLPEPHARAA